MSRSRLLWSLAAAMLFVFSPLSPVQADGAAVSYGFKLGPELFHWEEFDDGSKLADGATLVEEVGPRFTVGGFIGNLLDQDRGLIFNVDGRVYFGVVDYDGHVQSSNPALDGQPIESDTGYFGFRVEGQGGYRFGRPGGAFAWDVLGSLGYDNWFRTIEDTTVTVSGTTYGVSGLEEYYSILFGKLGTGPSFRQGPWHGALQAGFKYPLSTYEYLDSSSTGFDEDTELSPGRKTSAYLTFNNRFRLKGRTSLRIDFYYDSYRFSKSDPEPYTSATGSGIVWQPESHMDVWGMQFGLSF